MRDGPFISAKQALNQLRDSLMAHHHCDPACLPEDRCMFYLGVLHQFVEFDFFLARLPRVPSGRHEG